VKTLILGGVRSGKSRLAEQLARASGLDVSYIATATTGDEEMCRRIRAHQAQRPPSWMLVEEPRALASALRTHAAPDRCVLVDCLTLWLTNLLCTDDEAAFAAERRAVVKLLRYLPGHVILVSNETGMGVVPLGALTRRYCDEAGRLHQDLAPLCDRVILTVAGLPHVLKGDPLWTLTG
jgi:adenosylcobinamide kinase/adenosylcobinamide-phosphate guanylyltransferase